MIRWSFSSAKFTAFGRSTSQQNEGKIHDGELSPTKEIPMMASQFLKSQEKVVQRHIKYSRLLIYTPLRMVGVKSRIKRVFHAMKPR